MPSVLSLFPGKVKRYNEETYINENVLGHKFLNKAFKATYESGTDNFSIFIIVEILPLRDVKKQLDAYLESSRYRSSQTPKPADTCSRMDIMVQFSLPGRKIEL